MYNVLSRQNRVYDNDSSRKWVFFEALPRCGAGRGISVLGISKELRHTLCLGRGRVAHASDRVVFRVVFWLLA